MIETYVVVNQPALARPEPSPSAQIINSYPIDSKIQIVNEDSGWYKTISGTYIFKTKQNLIPLTKWKKLHANDLIMAKSLNKQLPPPLRRSLQKLSGTISVNDNVRLKNNSVYDIYTGNKVADENWTSETTYVVLNITSDAIIIQDTTTMVKYAVDAEDLQISDENGEWIDASSVATSADQLSNTISNTIDKLLKSAVNSSEANNVTRNIGNLDVKSIRAVYGMPYQFLPIADNRIDGSTNLNVFGRKYADKIATRAPILILQAGVPEFMRGWNEDIKGEIVSSIESKTELNLSEEQMMTIANTGSQYYTLKLVPGQYYNVVNQMSRAMTKLLRISDVTWNVGGNEIALGDMQWEKDNMRLDVIAGLFNLTFGQVCFYINAEPQIQESISNQTTQSQILSKLNDLGRMGSELQFLLGGASAKMNKSWGFSILPTYTGENKVTSKEVLTDGGILDSFIDNFQTAIAGGRFIFPDLWADSQFMRSYTVNIKLDSPDCDNVSIFINIFLPLIHLLAFCLPRSIGNNNYTSPFLVRAFFKSMFHTDLGIITDCQITKGDVGAWTQTGLPTQVNVQLTIKDLYSLITLATGIGNNSILANPGQMDYIANMCGVNLSAPALARSIMLWWNIYGPGAILNHIGTALDGMKTSLYNSLLTRLTTSSVIPPAMRSRGN